MLFGFDSVTDVDYVMMRGRQRLLQNFLLLEKCHLEVGCYWSNEVGGLGEGGGVALASLARRVL